jgi:hypothetical protein
MCGKNVYVICSRQLLPTFLFPGKSHVGKIFQTLTFHPGSLSLTADYNNPLIWIQEYRFLKVQKPNIIVLQWWASLVAHMRLLLKLFAGLLHKPKIILEFHEVVDHFGESKFPIRL